MAENNWEKNGEETRNKISSFVSNIKGKVKDAAGKVKKHITEGNAEGNKHHIGTSTAPEADPTPVFGKDSYSTDPKPKKAETAKTEKKAENKAPSNPKKEEPEKDNTAPAIPEETGGDIAFGKDALNSPELTRTTNSETGNLTDEQQSSLIDAGWQDEQAMKNAFLEFGFDTDAGDGPTDTDVNNARQVRDTSISELESYGVKVERDENGNVTKYIMPEIEYTKKGGFWKALTGLSIGLFVLTGGAFPPINFYQLSGAEGENEAARNNAYDVANKYLSQVTEGAGRGASEGAYISTMSEVDEDKASQTGKIRSKAEKDEAIDKLGTESQLTVMSAEQAYDREKTDKQFAHEVEMAEKELENQLSLIDVQHTNQKEMARILYEQSVSRSGDEYANMLATLKTIKNKYGKDYETLVKEMAVMKAAQAGITENQLNAKTIDQYEKIVLAPLDTVGNVISSFFGGK